MIISNNIRKIENGYIVQLRWPYGEEVFCSNLFEIFEHIARASDDRNKDAVIAALQEALKESEGK